MTRTKKIASFFLAASLLAGGGYFMLRKQAAADPEKRYRTEALARGSVTQTVSANGTLNPVTLVNVGTQVSGTVRKLHVDFNDLVEKGQVLAELDDAIYSAQVRQSDAGFASAQASAQLARANEARMRQLFQQEYVSRQELDQAVQTRETAEAQQRLARAQNDRDRANLGYSVIRSPVSGVVVDRQIDVGQTVAASFQTPTLFKIAQDLTQMQIYTTFAEADIGAIRVDQPVRFNVDAFPNRRFEGRVKQVRLNPTTQQNVVTYNVVVAVENPEKLLMPGMTAYVNIIVAQRKDALLVPNAALRFKPAGADRAEKAAGRPAEGGETARPEAGRRPAGAPGEKRRRETGSGTVHVIEAGQLKPVIIGTGISDGRFTEVLGGELAEGARVVAGESLPAANNAGASGSTFRLRPF
ncbi:MAG: efflux RND transporter periplasmic adaptor subunit [Zoogloeaceae bacterium]|nr:efflux RND transporter periplasmic adaptor subunit [Zoogloeaceae bacterium]MCK6385643.1 efflux RND transporter periplasmic adaptor subunit [Rhodocyclaceae bacterium]